MAVFRERWRPLDWDEIAKGKAVESTVRDPLDTAELVQNHLDNLTFGKINRNSLPEPALMMKALEYSQLTIEYLLQVQESLSVSLLRANEVLDESVRKENKARGNAKKLKDTQATLHAASSMLATFGVDVDALQNMTEAGGSSTNQSSAYVWVPAYLDPYDGKVR
jgi:hypothetical protein